MEHSILFGLGLFFALIFLFFSAIISAADVAFFSFTKKEVNQMKKNENRKIRLIAKLLEDPNRLLTTIVSADILINLLFVTLSVSLIHSLWSATFPVYILLLIDIVSAGTLIFVIGEIIPKVYAARNLPKAAQIVAPFLWIFTKILYPLTSLLLKSSNYIEKKIHIKMQSFSINEYSEVIDPEKGTHQEEALFMKGIANFRDKDVKQIMRSRMDIVAIETHTSLSDVVDIVKKHGYSRIPVYKKTFDQVEGILYVKDLLPYISKQSHFELGTILHKPFYIPESKLIGELLSDFKAQKIHFAIVVDEYGVVSGIVTLEDIIEEIVGDIKDEFDGLNTAPEFVKINDTSYLFPGKFPLTDFAKIMNIEEDFFDEIKGENDTLAGLLIEYVKDVPEKGEIIKLPPFEFKIEQADQQRIKEIRATYIPEPGMNL